MGFTLWDTVAYCAFAVTIWSIFLKNKDYGAALMTLAASILLCYALFSVHDIFLTSLQLIIVLGGVFQFSKMPKRSAIISMTVYAGTVSAILIGMGVLSNLPAILGFFGLLALAFGLLFFTLAWSSIFMAVGSVLVSVYSYHQEAWVFFLLNIAFFFVNAYTFLFQKKIPLPVVKS